ncbi:restriction endonuclease subunit S [Paraburkholderia graminis]|uniref:restriction endonuclease subunit S n=1 Tax=Paraburkholderia graminis TaxID=60548 RepID=UPI00286CF1C8|nr:restriction endonuclease subunit S [Paraburkholderia graminis]
MNSGNDWVKKPLIDVATLQRGYDLPIQDRTNGQYPVFAANGPIGFHGAAKCKGPGVVTGRSGTIGRVHFVEGDYWPLNTSLYVKDFHGNHPRWIYYMLQSFGLERFSQGAGVPTLNRNLIHTEPISVPPIAEQHRIAAILDKLDELRAKRKETLALLDSMAHSIFVDMFGDPVRGNGRNQIQLLGTLAAPERYSIVDGPFGSSIKPDDYVESGVPVIRIANITKRGEFLGKNLLYIKKKLFDELRRSSVRAGDVLVSRVGTIGNTCIFPDGVGDALLSTTGVCKITPNKELILPEYLHCAIRTPSFQSQINASASTSVQKYFNLSALKSWKLVVPPLVEQNQFVEKLKKLSALRKKIEDSFHHCDALSASAQYRAFRGEL